MASSGPNGEQDVDDVEGLKLQVRKLAAAVSGLERSLRTVNAAVVSLRRDFDDFSRKNVKKGKSRDVPATQHQLRRPSSTISATKSEASAEQSADPVSPARATRRGSAKRSQRAGKIKGTIEFNDSLNASFSAEESAHLKENSLTMAEEQKDIPCSIVEAASTDVKGADSEKEERNTSARESDEELFQDALRLQHGIGCPKDLVEAINLLQVSANRGHIDSMLALADIYYEGATAKAGSRHEHKRAALAWWDKVLSRDSNNVRALYRKGEALFQIDEFTPPDVLNRAFMLFDKAASLGSKMGMYLKGTWLVTMAPNHRDHKRAAEGKKLVEEAAENGFARAYVFLGHCYEFPDNYKPAIFDKPSSLIARERLILNLYEKAAKLKDPNGLNDLGSCYATGYGGIESNFEKAAGYYERAIEAGSLDAYDNLGTHYETGMNGACPDRIDFEKALHYYRLGAKRNCPKCALNLAIAYDEGMKAKDGRFELAKDSHRAEKYYKLAMALATDANDSATHTRASKDLVSFYITKFKLAPGGGVEAENAVKKMRAVMKGDVFDVTMADVNAAILSAVLGNAEALEEKVGEENARVIVDHGSKLVHRARCTDPKLSEAEKAGIWVELKQMFGSTIPDDFAPLQSVDEPGDLNNEPIRARSAQIWNSALGNGSAGETAFTAIPSERVVEHSPDHAVPPNKKKRFF